MIKMSNVPGKDSGIARLSTEYSISQSNMHQLTVLLEYIDEVSAIPFGVGQAHTRPGPPLGTPLDKKQQSAQVGHFILLLKPLSQITCQWYCMTQ